MTDSPVTKSITAQNTFSNPVKLAVKGAALVKIRTGGSTVVIQLSNDDFVSDITDTFSTTLDSVQNVRVEGNCSIRAGVKTGGFVGNAYVEIR
jgi:hypothetical protein